MITKAGAAWAASALIVVGAGGAVTYSLELPAKAATTGPSGGTASAATGNDKSNQGGGQGNLGNGNAGHPIKVSWVLNAPLILGAQRTLTTTVTNQNNQAMKVTKVSARILRSSVAACNTSWLTIGTFNGSKTVAANDASTIDLPITLADMGVSTKQDACKLASFDIEVTATAEQA